MIIISYTGKKIVKLEVSSGEKSTNTGIKKSSKRSKNSGLEFKLDELRKELSTTQGGIFPHSVLSTQQISLLSSQKPKTIEEVRLHIFIVLQKIVYLFFLSVFAITLAISG